MKNKAINALIEIGIPSYIKGFRYIVDAMCLFEENEWRCGKITTLYFNIGQMNNDTPSRVERAIRHAFKIAITSGDEKALKKYLTNQNTTNGNLLHVLYFRLTQEG